MNYVHITYDAILEFTSGRTFQSAEFEKGATICRVLKGESPDDWESGKILMKKYKNGTIFFTKTIDSKRGICFDLNTFNVSQITDDVIVTIFQKSLKYAVKYFEKLPTTNSEKIVANTNLSLVFPYPFTATREVDKVYIDRNSSKL